MEELVDSDSDVEEIIVRREVKEEKGKVEKKKGRSIQGEARRGMEKEVAIEEELFIGDVEADKRKKMKIKFQVADVKKPLMAVKRIVENGNRVVFSESGSYIINDKTGDKLNLRENGRGSYLMDVDFVGGGKGEITIDSGAEESFCLREWGSRFRIKEVAEKQKFRAANGNQICHYGERDVFVTSEAF